MQVSVETLEGLERRIKVQVPADKVETEVSNRLKSVGRTARIKGFRPGKVPPKVIEQRYGPQVRREVLSELMQSSFSEAITQENLNPAGGPRIEPSSLDKGQDLEYTATFEVYPDITIATSEGLVLRRPVAAIEAEDVDRVIEDLRTQRAEWQSVDVAAAAGHRVVVDFSGTLDGEAFEGGSGENVPVVLGAGGMLEDFENGLLGASAGDTRSFDVNFPAGYHAADLAGRTAVFEATVHQVEEQKLPEVDDAFCALFGIDEGGVDALRKGVEENMTAEMNARVDGRMRQRVLEAFLAANPVEVPAALVDDEVRALQDESMRRMGLEDESQRPPSEPFVEQARKRVALGLLIGEFIKQEKLEPDSERVEQRLEALVAGHEKPDAMMRAYRSSEPMMQRLGAMALEDQVVERLLDKASIAEDKLSFRELMDLDD